MIDYKINTDIKYKEVLVIDNDGNQLGIMTSKEAYFKAKNSNLDLVCVAPTAKIPVCKILNYGKFKYEQR